MIPVSPAFADQVRRPHTSIARVEVVRDDVVVRNLAVLSGTVEADRSGRILRRFSASVADPMVEFTPAGIRDLLAPFGTILRMYRGVRIPVVNVTTQITDSTAQWNAGTKSGTIAAASGDLELGT
jgi:hypothetical protein